MPDDVVVESAETQAREDKSDIAIQKSVLDIKSAVNDITDQNDLATKVSEKVLSSLKLLFQQQADQEAESANNPPPEATPEAEATPEEDVSPRRSHRLFRKIGRKEE
jgi:phage-related minor tail protein